MLAFAEGLLLAERSGIDRGLAVDVMTQSPIGSPMLKARAPLVLDLPEEAWFDIGLMQKDIGARARRRPPTARSRCRPPRRQTRCSPPPERWAMSSATWQRCSRCWPTCRRRSRTMSSTTTAASPGDEHPKPSSILRRSLTPCVPAPPPRMALPPLMVLLTIVTGVVDAVAYLRLGSCVRRQHDRERRLPRLLGCRSRGPLCCRLAGRHRRASSRRRRRRRSAARSVTDACTSCGRRRVSSSSSLPAAILVRRLPETTSAHSSRYALIILLALAMGVQNATARRLAVPDLTTTVLTLTLTGIAADSQLAAARGQTPAGVSSRSRRCCSARPSARCSCSQVAPAASLVLAVGILAVVCFAAHRAERAHGTVNRLVMRAAIAWTRSKAGGVRPGLPLEASIPAPIDTDGNEVAA